MTLQTDRPVQLSATPDAEALFREAKRRERRRRLLAIGAVFLLAGGIVTAVSAGGAGHGSDSATRSAGASAPAASAPQGSPSAKGVLAIKVPGLFGTRSEPPIGLVIAFGAGSTWVLGENGVVRLNSTTGRIQAAVSIKGFAENLAFTGGNLWVESVVLGTGGYLLSEVGPSTDTVLRRTVIDRAHSQQGFGGSYQTLAAEDGYLYLELGTVVVKIDGATGVAVSTERTSPLYERVDGSDQTIPELGALASANHADATILGGRVWATSAVTVKAPTPTSFGQHRWELNEYVASTGAKLGVSVPNIWLVAAGDGQLWGIEQTITSNYRDTLVEIDASNGHVERRVDIPTAAGGSNPALTITDGAVWVVEPTAETVFRVALVS